MPMFKSSHQSETSSPAASASPDLEAVVERLRGLSGAKIRELREAIANHDAENLAGFLTRFQNCLNGTLWPRSW
jgi:hypothetical protein